MTRISLLITVFSLVAIAMSSTPAFAAEDIPPRVMAPAQPCVGDEGSFAAGVTEMNLPGGRCEGAVGLDPRAHAVTHCQLVWPDRPVAPHMVALANAPKPHVASSVGTTIRSEGPIPVGDYTVTVRCEWRSEVYVEGEGENAVVIPSMQGEITTMSFVFHVVDRVASCADATATTPYETPVATTLTCAPVWGTRAVSQQPAHGTLRGPDAAGAYVYSPDAGYSGVDRYVVTSTNALGATSATVQVRVGAKPEVPVAAAAPAKPTLVLHAAPILRSRSASTMRVECDASAAMHACVVTARYGRAIIGGFKLATNVKRAGVALRLNALGKRLVATTPGGIRVSLSGRATFDNGPATATTSTRIVPASQRIVPPMVVLFDANEATLSTRGEMYLRALGRTLTAAGARAVTCEGFVSTTGNDGNPGLAAERASVGCGLLRRGGLRARFTIVSRNLEDPRTSNSTESSRRFNRRFELVVSY